MGKPKICCSYSELRDPKKLIPNPLNPNTHPEVQIKILIGIFETLGWRLPITVSDRSGMIVRGHGRLIAALRMGLDEVPVDVQHYESDSQEMSDLLADNQIPELAVIDNEKMKSIIEKIDQDDMKFTGFSQDDLDAILSEPTDVVQDDFLGDDFQLPGTEIEEKRALVKLNLLVEERIKKDVLRRLDDIANEYGDGQVRVMR